jgi:hypothetical protein
MTFLGDWPSLASSLSAWPGLAWPKSEVAGNERSCRRRNGQHKWRTMDLACDAILLSLHVSKWEL